MRECLVGVDAFRDYQAEAAARKALVVVRHRLGRQAIFRRRDAGHGGNAEPILESAAFYINRRDKWGFHVDLQSSVVSDAANGIPLNRAAFARAVAHISVEHGRR